MKLLLYCNKTKPYLVYGYINKFTMEKAFDITYSEQVKNSLDCYNGKIVGECDFEVEEIKLTPFLSDKETYINEKELLKNSCLSYRELADYIGSKGYAIHIKNLNIFDRPRELNEIYKYNKPYWIKVEKPPQNMMSLGDKEYILISIRSEWLVKILNGEKTIEIRKKVLKEMINNA